MICSITKWLQVGNLISVPRTVSTRCDDYDVECINIPVKKNLMRRIQIEYLQLIPHDSIKARVTSKSTHLAIDAY